MTSTIWTSMPRALSSSQRRLGSSTPITVRLQGNIFSESGVRNVMIPIAPRASASRAFTSPDAICARSSAGKLARLLLSWTSGREEAEDAREIRVRSVLTHEEMAQMIGSSRETVTRLLSELKKKELIRLEGSTLVIRNRTALEALAA